MRPRIFIEDLRHTAIKALRSGATVRRFQSVHWDTAGNCSAPVTRELSARPTRRSRLAGYPQGQSIRAETERYAQITATSQTPLWLDLEVRCRKCANCLKRRAMMWTYRAKAETMAASRTWFFTLTLSPAEHYTALCRAASKEAIKGSNLDGLTHAQQFDARHRSISPLLTLFFKRVRKESDAPIRYLCVAEAHKSGLPHYHGLIHEVAEGRTVKHATLTKQWAHGFSKFNLVTADDLRAVHYACKYLSKDQSARVRASLGYGTPDDLCHRQSRDNPTPQKL